MKVNKFCDAMLVLGDIADNVSLYTTAVIGAVEELAQTNRTLSLVQDTFETNFFANVNIIKAALPIMRERKNGHIIMLTGISKFLLSHNREISVNEPIVLTAYSGPSGNPRTWNVLFLSVGHRRILRRKFPNIPSV